MCGYSTMDVDALLFDVGGTVFDWRTAVMDALQRAESDGLRKTDLERFGEYWRKRSLVEAQDMADAMVPRRPFDAVLAHSLDQTLSDLGIFRISETDRKMLLAAWEYMPAWPRVPGALARLREKYFVAPHTILSLRVAAFSSRNAGLTWDAIISCDALGATKPDPGRYTGALTVIGRPGPRVCFVAAHPSDLRAARAHGMKTAYVVARLHDYGDDYEDTGFASEFDVVADDFNDLADRLT